MNLTPANTSGTWEAKGPSRAIVMLIPGAFLSRVISEHWEVDPRNVEIIPQFLARDPVIQGVATHLALEARNDSSIGATICRKRVRVPRTSHHPRVFIAFDPPPQSSGGLSGRRLKLVLTV